MKKFQISIFFYKNIDDANVKIIDLNKPLLPVDIYDPIKCKKSAKFIESTYICIHDLEKDIFVSADIWNTGSFEKDLVGKDTLINI